MLTICNRLGLADGLSPALTSATREVQNNISTMAVAPSSVATRTRVGGRRWDMKVDNMGAQVSVEFEAI